LILAVKTTKTKKKKSLPAKAKILLKSKAKKLFSSKKKVNNKSSSKSRPSSKNTASKSKVAVKPKAAKTTAKKENIVSKAKQVIVSKTKTIIEAVKPKKRIKVPEVKIKIEPPVELDIRPNPEKVKSILVTQPRPETEKSPYFDLAKKCNVKVDFRAFIHVEGVTPADFRKDKINILDHTAVIFTSRNAADHFFRICSEMRITVPESMKYFCISESTAYYLQKYVLYRKRKIFHGKQTFLDMMDVVKKHKDEKFLLPCSDIAKEEGPEILDKFKINYTKAVIYKTVCSDLSDLANVNYDVLVFFSPAGIKSLFQNFPKFKQNNTRIAAFGPTTAKAVKDANLKLDIHAPMPAAPSMTMALEQYIAKVNKGK
jgi:uroporphyrinogen-III synthase